MAVNDGRVVSNFIIQALDNRAITIYGDGKQTRSFCYVTDTVDAILKTLYGDYSQPLNVGNPDEYTMIELAEAVLGAVGSTRSGVAYFTLPQDDPKQRKPDITKINKLYGWKPTVKLDKGLAHTVKYFRKLKDKSQEA
jgi:UDP-glucuronate decarboxylase